MPTAPCPACGADAFVVEGDGGSCSRCGNVTGESNRCPHCRAVARIEGSGARAVCAACGGPRVPSNLGGEEAEVALRQQQKALGNARLASFATLLQGLVAVVVALLGLALAPASATGRILVFALAAVPLFLALRSRSQATRARATAKDAGERAWKAAAEAAAAATKGGVTVEELAQKLGVDSGEAERLLTALAAGDRARIDVDDAAEVRYSVAPGPRIATDAGRPRPLLSEDELPGESAADEAASSERGGSAR